MEAYASQNKTHGPIGWVRMFEQKDKNSEKKLFFEGHNMVVAQGRAFVAQKIFNFASGQNDWRNYKISHFAVGAGGASVSNDNVTMLGPMVCDTSLYKPIGLNSTHNEPGAYDNSALADEYKDIYTSIGAVKPIDSLELVAEDYQETNSSCSALSRMKCTCTVESGEPSALPTDGYVPISEAGLYFVYGTDARMFAHVCFAPKFKELDSILTIEWFILC